LGTSVHDPLPPDVVVWPELFPPVVTPVLVVWVVLVPPVGVLVVAPDVCTGELFPALDWTPVQKPSFMTIARKEAQLAALAEPRTPVLVHWLPTVGELSQHAASNAQLSAGAVAVDEEEDETGGMPPSPPRPPELFELHASTPMPRPTAARPPITQAIP
jgi:hypothetical protein